MNRRTLLATIRKFGSGNLARALGVSPSTVRRWRSGATPKPDSIARLESLTAEAVPLTPSALLRLPSATLADYAGVTERTARGWLKKGKVPQRYQEKARLRSLVESRIGEQTKLPRASTLRKQYVGKFTRGVENRLTWSKPVHLGPMSIGAVLDFIRGAELSRFPGESWLQVVITAKSDSDFSSVLTSNHYGTTLVSSAPEMVFKNHTFAGSVQKGRNMVDKAAKEMGEILSEASPFNFYLESVSIYHRRARK